MDKGDQSNTRESILIVGNKQDLMAQEVVPVDEVKDYAKSLGAFFTKASALNGWSQISL